MKRVLTALVLIPAIVAVTLAAPKWLFLAVLTIIAVLCFYEFNGIVSRHGTRPPGMFGYIAGLLVLLAPTLDGALIVVLAVVTLSLSLRWDDLAECLPWAGAVFLGIVYVFGCWRFAAALHDIDHRWLLFALTLSWVGDIAAYYVGRRFGRHRLAPAASPKKSWEGAIASVAGSVAYAAAYFHWIFPSSRIPIAGALGIAAIANVAGQLGDLAESALKRGAGMKDSSTLLPGHGGWLDRVDSTLFALPVVYVLVTWLAPPPH